MRVGVRVRPFSEREVQLGSGCVVSASSQAAVVQVGSQLRRFDHDAGFDSLDAGSKDLGSQGSVYDFAGAGLLSSAIDGDGGGAGGCVLVYGAAGTGKTYTIAGTDEEPGIIPRMAEDLFARAAALEAPCDADARGPAGRALRVWASFVEVRGEQVRDLLRSGPGDAAEVLRVVDHPQLGALLPDAAEVPCASAEDVRRLLAVGSARRVASASLLRHGTASGHVIFSLRLQVHHAAAEGRAERVAKIDLVDLVGSEGAPAAAPERPPGAAPHRLFAAPRPGQVVNEGLVALHAVVECLGRPRAGAARQMLAFRASKLTLLLRETLLSSATLLATVSPAQLAAAETLRTLDFAAAARRLRPDAQSAPGLGADAIAHCLQAEAARLRALPPSAPPAGALGLAPGDAAFLEQRLQQRQRLQDLQARVEEAVARVEACGASWTPLGMFAASRSGGASAEEVEAAGPPVLLNLSDDPALAGCLAHPLGRRQLTTVGSLPECDVVVSGLGVPGRLCQIEVTAPGTAFISYAPGVTTRGAVRVNTAALEEGERRQLFNMDRLVFGRAAAFCVAMPAGAAEDQVGSAAGDPGSSLPGCCYDPDLSKLFPSESSAAWSELQSYFDDLWQRLGEERGHDFFAFLGEAAQMADEANEIAMEVRPCDRLKFEVELVWDITREVRDIIVIRLMRFPEDDTSPPVLGYFTLPAFRARVARMRECYEAFVILGRWSGVGDAFEDAWMEPSASELLLHLRLRTEEELQAQLVQPPHPPAHAQHHPQHAAPEAHAPPHRATARTGAASRAPSAGAAPQGSPKRESEDRRVSFGASPSERAAQEHRAENGAAHGESPQAHGEESEVDDGQDDEALVALLRQQLQEHEAREQQLLERIAEMGARITELRRQPTGPRRGPGAVAAEA